MQIFFSADPRFPVGLSARLRPWLGMLVLVIAACFVYGPSLGGEFLWGDDVYVTENEALRAEDGLRQLWSEPQAGSRYEPLVQTTFWVQYRLHGPNPGPFRIANLVLHIFNALLLLALLRHLKVPGAWLVAALFLLHPIHVDSVAWIARRANTLSLFFYLASLHLFCRAYRLGIASASRPPARWPFVGLFAGGLLLFVGALLSNAITCTLPVTLWLLIWWKRGALDVKTAVQTLSLIVIGIASGVYVARMETGLVPVPGAEGGLTHIEQCLLAGRVFWFYVGKLLLPVGHVFIYPPWEFERDALSFLFPAAALVLVVMLWGFRNRLGRGPLVAVLFYMFTLLPSLVLLREDPLRLSFVADHVPYHAGIGVLVLLAGSLTSLADRVASTMFIREQEFTRGVFASLTLPILGVLGMLTWQQARVYANEIALWRDTIAKNPAAWMAYDHLIDALGREGRMDEAVEVMRRAVADQPEYPDGPYRLARLLQATGRYEDALEHLDYALNMDPHFVSAHIHRGEVLLRMGRVREAEEHWRTALHLDPDSVDARRNLGNQHLARGRLDLAASLYAEALALDPDENVVRFRLGVVRYRQERHEEAASLFAETIRREPEHADAWNNKGLSLSQMGEPEEALNCYDRAVGIRPTFAQAWHNRGVALDRLGRYDEAEESYRNALDANPDFEPARKNLRELEWMRPLR